MRRRKLIFFLAVVFVAVSFLMLRCDQQDTAVLKIIINQDYDKVWNSLSDPQNYPRFYPNWVKKVTKLAEEDRFQVEDQFGHSYKMQLIINKDFGVIDLQIGPESSRSRLYKLDEHRTAIVHLAKRWKDATAVMWFFHKRTTSQDFKNAKALLENLSQ